MNDVIVNKCASIERAIARAKEEYAKDPSTFSTDYTRQDAAILNIQRACEAALDLGHHIIRTQMLGIPQHSRDVFAILGSRNKISMALSTQLQKMVGFRNIAVHDYQSMSYDILEAVLLNHLSALLEFSRVMLKER